MNSEHIPDDVWIEIFENVDDAALLLGLTRTCQRFRSLAMKPLLRAIHWRQLESTSKNLDDWRDVYQDMVSLVRKITLGIPFDFNTRGANWTQLTPEMEVYDAFHLQLPAFTSLHELVFDGTTIFPYTYHILTLLPSLRVLSLNSCKFLGINWTFKDHYSSARPQSLPDSYPFQRLGITHLSLHKVQMPHEHDHNPAHPMHLTTAPKLVSLSITWSTNQAITYASTRWPLPCLTFLDVTMPHLTRDLIDSLVGFVQHCPLGPKIALCIERHSLSDQQINSLHFPLRGVWRYKGPLPIASFSTVKKSIARDDPDARLKHLVMNEPMELVALVDGLENLPEGLETLEIQVRKWDVELLHAIRWLFPRIRSLVVRYGKGALPHNLFETLGSDILFTLPNLHTFKILYDEACTVTTRQLAGFHHMTMFTNLQPLPNQAPHQPPNQAQNQPQAQAQNQALNHHHHHNQNTTADDDDADTEHDLRGGAYPTPPVLKLEHSELGDYLVGWNRFCKSLRHIQVCAGSCWERRFEGDGWVEIEVRGKEGEA